MGIVVGLAGLIALGSWLIVPLGPNLEMPASAYKSWIDRTVVRTGYTIRGWSPPCLIAAGGTWDGSIQDITEVKPWDQCLRFTPPRRWKGIAELGLENSRFCDGARDRCPPWEMDPLTWLEFRPGSTDGFKIRGAIEGPHLDRIEFIGRRTIYPGQFGHMGGYDHHMIVDRMISIQELEPPPPEPTKAEVVAQMKACEANRTCIPDWKAINRLKDSGK